MGRGGGGGGRSFGGGFSGGSRSSGGFHGGSSSHRGGYGSSRPSSSSYHSSPRPSGGGFYRPPAVGGGYHRPPPPPRRDVVHVHHYDTPYYGETRRDPSDAVVLRGGRLFVSVIVWLIITIIFISYASHMLGLGGETGITKSTVAREKLDAQYVTTTDYYRDDAGWISSSSKLQSGLKYFYKETGVQPFLYITETVDGITHPSDSQMESFANALYDKLFTDEGHVLVVFQEYNSDSRYFCYAVAGKMAKTVFDSEARSILFDYIDHYYYSDLNEDEFFSTAFEKTADRMMTVTKSPLPKIIISVVVLIMLIVAFIWWQKAKEQKNREAEHTERILNADLGGKLSDSDTSELEKKYQDDEE